ncbi:hypothetical protein A4X13_0g9310, partial [Tilletia indica]
PDGPQGAHNAPLRESLPGKGKQRAAAAPDKQEWTVPVEWRATGRYPVKEGSRTLGQGGFGIVMHCVDLLLPSKEVAKKRQMLEVGCPVPNKYILREIAALRRCQGHVNVIDIKDVIYNADAPSPYVDIILPLAAASLDRVIRHEKGGVDVITAKTFVQQVLKGLCWIHHRGWLHLDLKPANVLIFRDFTCRITDFGLAKKKNPALKLSSPCGTIGYRPPEELFNTHYADESMDVWPVGTIYAELRKGGAIFDTSSNVACFKSMIEVTGVEFKSVFEFPAPGSGIEGGRTFLLRPPNPARLSHLNPEELTFIMSIFTLEPRYRPSARGVFKHRFWDRYPKPDKSLLTLSLP